MDKENLKKIQKEINNQIGDKSFQKLIEIKRLSDTTNELLRDKKYLDKDFYGKFIDSLTLLSEKLEEVRDKEYPEFPDFPRSFEISNFPRQKEVEFPANLKQLKNVDLEPLIKAVFETSKISTKALQQSLEKTVVGNKEPDDAIPVRIVLNDKGTKTFLDTMDTFGQPGWGPEVFHTGVKNPSGEEDYLRINENNELIVEATLSAANVTIGNIRLEGSAGDKAEVDSTERLYTVEFYDNFEQATAGMTQANAAITLSQQVKLVDIQNTGDNTVYVNFDAVATTSHIAVEPGLSYRVPIAVTAINGICAAGLTSTLRVVGYY